MIDRDSASYRAGRVFGRFILIGLAYFFGKKWAKPPLERQFPKKSP
jgi:hypothetical protein